jgi:phosphopantothenoylcysteine synthetase/decarboxylase
MQNVTLVACGGPLAARVHDVAEAIVASGWDCVVIASPAGSEWVDPNAVERVTGFPPTVEQRAVNEPRRGPLPDAVVAAPITFNTLNKIAVGISDTYAAGALCEAIARRIPLLLVPMISTRLWDHPAVSRSITTLRECGVHFLSLTADRTPAPTPSGQGNDLVTRFDPKRIAAFLHNIG